MSISPSRELLEALEKPGVKRRWPFWQIHKISRPNPSKIDSILDERKKQRAVVFWFAIISASVSIFYLFGLIGFQVYKRSTGLQDFSVLSVAEMEVLSVSIFGQVISVILVIANSVWNHTDFKEFYRQDDLRDQKKFEDSLDPDADNPAGGS